MNSSSRLSRLAAIGFFVPVFLVCSLWGAAYVFAGLSEIRFARLPGVAAVGVGSLSLIVAVGCLRKMRQIFGNLLEPWGRATKWAMAGDVLLVLLVLVAIPKVQMLRRYGANGATRGQLGTFRQAIIDYHKQKGTFPTTLSELGTSVPVLTLFGMPHAPSQEVRYAALTETADSGQWLYDNQPQDPGFGTVLIDCSHQDDRGHPWSSY